MFIVVSLLKQVVLRFLTSLDQILEISDHPTRSYCIPAFSNAMHWESYPENAVNTLIPIVVRSYLFISPGRDAGCHPGGNLHPGLHPLFSQ